MRPTNQFPDNYVTCFCPSCFEEICLGDCQIISAIDGSIIKHVPTMPDEREYARVNPEPLTGRYALQQAQRKCYNCDYLLPFNIELVPSFIIAVVGDPFSGKSHFITALLYQLYQWMNQLDRHRAQLLCLTEDVEADYKKNLNDLFGAQQMLGHTTPAVGPIAPLIYELSIGSNSFLKKEVRRCNIMIYDTSGEDFKKNNRLVQYGKFALHAGAFIFVADPVPIEPIFRSLDSSRLSNYAQLDLNYRNGRRPVEIVKSVMATVQRYRHTLNTTTRYPLSDVPVAIMVSKADLLYYFLPNREYSLKSFKRSPEYGIKVDFGDINQVDRDVRKMLRDYEQGDLFATINLINNDVKGNIRFFASTATGQPPDTNGQFLYAHPYRCIDPLLWILHQVGVLGRM